MSVAAHAETNQFGVDLGAAAARMLQLFQNDGAARHHPTQNHPGRDPTGGWPPGAHRSGEKAPSPGQTHPGRPASSPSRHRPR